MKNKSLITIIIVNYNSSDYTLECIESIHSQSVNFNYEIVVVDNSSKETDIEKLRNSNFRFSLIMNDMNTGFAKGNNLGISKAKGEYICLLNNDTILLNNALFFCLEKLESTPEIGVVGCKLLYQDLSWQKSYYEFPTIRNQLKKLFRIKEKSVDADQACFVPWLTGAFLMFRKATLENFEGKKLKEDFFMYCEDIQWGMQFKKLGLKCFYFPKGQIIHYQGKSSNFDDDFSKKLKYYYPNLKILLRLEKGEWYAKLYFITLIFTFLSDLRQNSYSKRIKPLIKVLLKC